MQTNSFILLGLFGFAKYEKIDQCAKVNIAAVVLLL